MHLANLKYTNIGLFHSLQELHSQTHIQKENKMTFCGYDELVVQTPPIGVAVQSRLRTPAIFQILPDSDMSYSVLLFEFLGSHCLVMMRCVWLSIVGSS